MMAKYYKVEFNYPDGHFEVFYDEYLTLEHAVQAGKNMINTVKNTEKLHHSALDSDQTKLIKPYFLVAEHDDKVTKTVFDSRKSK